jgi:hypothetical protein
MITETLAAEGGQNNFLLPNGTFFVELLLFVIVFVIFTKWLSLIHHLTLPTKA